MSAIGFNPAISDGSATFASSQANSGVDYGTTKKFTDRSSEGYTSMLGGMLNGSIAIPSTSASQF